VKLRLSLAAFAFGALLLSGCRAVPIAAPAAPAVAEQAAQPVIIQFAFQSGAQPVTCSTAIEALGTTQSPVQVNDARFYVSNVRLIDSSGAEIPVSLDQDGLWQLENTVLLDFEDGSAGCADAGTPDMNSVVRGAVQPGDYQGVVFQLGVPFERNHQDVTTAASPLNIPPMWWNWQGGYKFVRIDLKSDAEATDGAWFIHLGSTGCVSDNQAAAPATNCARPNLAEIRLDGFDPAASVVVADLATLLANVDLSQSTPQPPGCMSGPDDPDCAGLMPAFGLDPATGLCAEAGCPTQQFFRVE
jgi:uncharacterized repeat protein (TIGR04052 family)